MVSAVARDVRHLEASGHSNLGWASADLVDGWFGAVPVAQWGLVRLPNGAFISLPFDWLRSAFPQIAITHPLRLAAPAIILVSGIAAVAARALKPWQVIGLGALICCEGLFASATPWPLAHSDARIGTQYDRIATEDPRAILDLPAEAGTSMRTSQYFWYQTKHGRPIPYTPDVRLGSSDFETFKILWPTMGCKSGWALSGQPSFTSASNTLRWWFTPLLMPSKVRAASGARNPRRPLREMESYGGSSSPNRRR